MITGFRVARGGAQELLRGRARPDVLGKVLGGGLPAAAYGGRARADGAGRARPATSTRRGRCPGNPLAIAAGLATLRAPRRRRLRAPRARSPSGSPPASREAGRRPPAPGRLGARPAHPLLQRRAGRRLRRRRGLRPRGLRPLLPGDARARHLPAAVAVRGLVRLARPRRGGDRPHPRAPPPRRSRRRSRERSEPGRRRLQRPRRRCCARRRRRSPTTSSSRPRSRRSACSPPPARAPRPRRASTRWWSRPSARATSSTTAQPRLLAGHDPDLALLAGDYLYALGLERLPALGDAEAVRVLADLISGCARLHAEGSERPGARSCGGRSAAAIAGSSRREPTRRLRRINSAGPQFWITVADEADKQARGRGSPTGARPKPKPAGYFEGESMTRRKAFDGRRPRPRRRSPARRSSCRRSASPSRRSSTAARSAGRRSARPATSSTDTYRQVVFTETEGIGDAGKTTAYVRKGSKELGENPNEYIAVSNRCAHLGCPVRFVEAAGNFICPCHGGVYDFEGKVIGGPPGPPARPLPDPGPGRPGRTRPPLQRHLPARAGPRPRPGRVHRRHLGISVSAPSLHLPAAIVRGRR